MSAARERSFCRYCGAMTHYLDGCCTAHRDLLALDVSVTGDLDSAAMQAAPPREDSQATEGTEA